MENISVLICDDSALMRNLISRIVNGIEGMNVVATAINGQFALQKIPDVKPDIIILDIEMPTMNGIQFLEERRKRGIDIPVIILSSVAKEGAAVTMQCLELGASDFITKPGGSVSINIELVTADLVEMIASYGGMYASRHGKPVGNVTYFMRQVKMHAAEHFVTQQKGTHGQTATAAKEQPSPLLSSMEKTVKEPAVITPEREGGRIDIIAIGISTGGPNALREVFKMVSPGLQQPILVVQHMPPGFTAEFAISLDRICPLKVTEAKDNDVLEGGHIYIAPGDSHIYVESHAQKNVIRLSQDAPCNGHRPSVSYLFHSITKIYKNHALGVIMTGMGKDGAQELADMRKEGAWTLGQDEKTAIVYVMPKLAWELGGVQKQVALEDMAREICTLAKEHRTA